MNKSISFPPRGFFVAWAPKNQEINTSKHFNKIFIKVQTNSTNKEILMQARSYNLQWWKNKRSEKAVHPSALNSWESKKKDCVCVCDSKDRLGLDHSWSKRTKKLWANQHGSSRQKRPGCLGDEENNGDVAIWRIWEAGAPSTWQEVFPAPALVFHHDRIHRCRTNSIYSSSHKIRFLSICPEEATIVPYLFR